MLRAAFDGLDTAVIVVTPDEGVLFCNELGREWLGADPETMGPALFGYEGFHGFHEDGSPWPFAERQQWVDVLAGQVIDGQLMELRLDGSSRWLLVSARPLTRPGESTPYAGLGTVRDVTRQRAGRAALAESEGHFRLLAENAGDLIARHTIDGICTYASPAARDLLGREPDSLLGDWTAASTVHPDDVAVVVAAQERLTSQAEPYALRYRLQHADGRWLWVETVGRPVTGPNGAITEIQSATRDITARLEQEQRLARLALADSLTGLPNRAAMTQYLEDQLATEQPVALLFLDLDRFKVVNDSLGHSAGDELLRTVASRLAGTCRDGDLVTRLGGDEFVVVAPGLDEALALALADRIQRVLAVPVEVAGHELVISASVGIVVSDPNNGKPEAEALLRDADVSMYQAKARGRARAVVFTEAAGAHAIARLSLEGELRVALESEQLVVHYQPQVELVSGRIVGIEALVRWQHPERGLLAPDAFLETAEESGLIVALGRQVLAIAVEQLARWRKLPGCADLELAVNVSAAELMTPTRLELTLQLLRDADLPTSALTIEVLESVLFDAEGAVQAALHAYADAGICLALDDFGTGFSSLLHLSQMPIGALKVDRAFVAGLGTAPQDEAIVRALRSLTDDLDLGCIAEGVEDDTQRAWLIAQGVRLAQGYLLHRPLPADQLDALLRAGHGHSGG